MSQFGDLQCSFPDCPNKGAGVIWPCPVCSAEAQWSKTAQGVKLDDVVASGVRAGLDINLPTPAEVASSLMGHFCEDQANAIAAEVYQPIRDMLKDLALRGIR